MGWLDMLLAHPAHAVLLTGPDVVTALGAVDASQGLLAGKHEYLRNIAPDQKGTISIESVRDLIAFFRLKVPGTAAIRRVAVIDQAHTMTREAQNALLKLLEEPPADSVLLLTSSQPQELLTTIRSRLQTIHLQSEAQAPDDEAVRLVKQALAGTPYDRLLLVDGPLKPRESAIQFVTTLATVAEATLEATAKKGGSTERWQQVLRAVYTANEAFEHNANPKLVLTELMLAL